VLYVNQTLKSAQQQLSKMYSSSHHGSPL